MQPTEDQDRDKPPRPAAYVHPGRIVASRHPMVVMTILGSCVAVCLWDPEERVGGINHHVLPQGVADPPDALRYGTVAVPELIRQVVAFGAKPERLRAKLFGGASLLGSDRPEGGRLGRANVEVARRVLAEARIPIVAEDVEGQTSRKLFFALHDGTAWIRRR